MYRRRVVIEELSYALPKAKARVFCWTRAARLKPCASLFDQAFKFFSRKTMPLPSSFTHLYLLGGFGAGGGVLGASNLFGTVLGASGAVSGASVLAACCRSGRGILNIASSAGTLSSILVMVSFCFLVGSLHSVLDRER